MSGGVNSHGLGRRHNTRRIVVKSVQGKLGVVGGHMQITCKRGNTMGRGNRSGSKSKRRILNDTPGWVTDGLLTVFLSYFLRCMEDLEEGE